MVTMDRLLRVRPTNSEPSLLATVMGYSVSQEFSLSRSRINFGGRSCLSWREVRAHGTCCDHIGARAGTYKCRNSQQDSPLIQPPYAPPSRHPLAVGSCSAPHPDHSLSSLRIRPCNRRNGSRFNEPMGSCWRRRQLGCIGRNGVQHRTGQPTISQCRARCDEDVFTRRGRVLRPA